MSNVAKTLVTTTLALFNAALWGHVVDVTGSRLWFVPCFGVAVLLGIGWAEWTK